MKEDLLLYGPQTGESLMDQSTRSLMQQLAEATTKPPPAPKGQGKLLADIVATLSGRTTKTGGRLSGEGFRPDSTEVSFEPAHRERVDHYGTSYSDDGDEQEGWDSEGWEQNYAGPLRKEVAELLLKALGPKVMKSLDVDVGEKGHVYVQILKKGGNATEAVEGITAEAVSEALYRQWTAKGGTVREAEVTGPKVVIVTLSKRPTPDQYDDDDDWKHDFATPIRYEIQAILKKELGDDANRLTVTVDRDGFVMVRLP